MEDLEKLQNFEQKLLALDSALFDVYVSAPEEGDLTCKCHELHMLVRKALYEAERAEDPLVASAENGMYALLA